MNRAIDVWAQPANGLLRERVPEVARLFEKSGSGHLLDQRLSPEQTVALMDEAGVEKLMLAAWCRPEGWAISNEEVAVYTRAFPDRFVGVATVDLSKPVAAVRELERAVLLKAGDPTINDHLGDAYFKVGRKREAEFKWRQALELNPEPEDAEKIKLKLEKGYDALAAKGG